MRRAGLFFKGLITLLLGLCLLLTAWTEPVHSEGVIWSYDVGEPHGRDVLSDINGDGYDDLLLLIDDEWVKIISGADGSTELWSYQLSTANRYRRGLATINDLDGDGIKDIIVIVGTSGNGYGENHDDDEMYAVSGAVTPPGSRVLWGGPIHIGWGLCYPVILPDVNGDGYDDIFAQTMTPSGTRGDCGYHFSGADGSIFWTFTYPAESVIWDIYGRAVSPDLDGDGRADIIVCGAGGSSGVAAWKGGATESRIWRSLTGEWIRNPASVGDLTSDGVPEVAVARFNVAPPNLKLKVLDGSSGSLVWDFAFGNTASSIENLGDVTGDGYEDIVIGSYYVNNSGGTDYKVYALEGDPGATTREIWSYDLVDKNSYVKVVQDINGDGKKDVIVIGGNEKVLALSGADGALIWEEPFTGPTGAAQIGEFDGTAGEDMLTNVGYVVYALSLTSISAPVCDIKANGEDGPLVVMPGENVDVTVSLEPGSMTGEACDWWIGAFTAFGTYWLNPSLNWVPSDSPISVGQYPLFDLSEMSLLDIPLPEGIYMFFFVLDDTPDGTFGVTWYDYVNVICQPEAAPVQAEEIPDFDAVFHEKMKKFMGE